MGISKGGARLLLEEARFWPFSGRVLQLGRQHIFITPEEFSGLAFIHNIKLSTEHLSQNVNRPLLDNKYIDDVSFFASLGFSSVESLDFSNDEKPTHVHDLNLPLESDLNGRFDAVYDGGTMEHVFDTRSVLRNIFMSLKVGGRIIHASPSSNHVDHGFYMYSPTLFYDYYLVNNYRIHDFLLVEYSIKHNDEPWSIYEYEPGCLDSLSFGGFDKGRLLAIYVSAEKTPSSTWDKFPQQGMYARLWKDRDVLLLPQSRVRTRPRWIESRADKGASTKKSRITSLIASIFGLTYPAPEIVQSESALPNKIAEF